MATKETSKAVKVPHGQPIPEGMDLDTSEYVNEVMDYDGDPTAHPEYHENQYVGSQVEPLMDRIERLKSIQGSDPSKVEFRRRVDTRSGLVTALLYFPDGDRFGGQGKTTEEAVEKLEAKLTAVFGSAEEVAK